MKKGGWLKRGTEWLSRKVPIKARNAKRAKAKYEDAFGPPGFVEFVHQRGCLVARASGTTEGCLGAVEVAHVVPRSRGGSWRQTVGLCTGHHREQHAVGLDTFAHRHGLDLEIWADATCHQWDLKCARS